MLDREEIVAGMYDAAAEPESWAARLAELQSFLRAETILASLQRPTTGEVAMLACSFPEPIIRGYTETWWPHDPWMHGAERARGGLVSAQECLSDAEFRRTPIYNELVRPHMALRHMLGVVLPIGDRRVVLGVHRTAGAPDFSVAERHAMEELLPHVRRSIQLMLRLHAAGYGTALARTALDAIPHALLVVDRECRPIVLNGAAERLLARGDGLSAGTAGGPVTARGAEATRAIQRLVHSAAGVPRGPGGALRITGEAGAALYSVLVAPLAGQAAAPFGLLRPAALLFVHDLRTAPVPRRRVLIDLYGLTPAEASLADRLAGGARLEDVAEERDVRLSTIRTQVRAVFHKTGTSRQTELVQLLATLATVGGRH